MQLRWSMVPTACGEAYESPYDPASDGGAQRLVEFGSEPADGEFGSGVSQGDVVVARIRHGAARSSG